MVYLQVWKINRERAVDYLNTRNRIYVVDGFAGWDEKYRINVRVVCARAYHALFMRNMLIRPSRKELEHFRPDYTIYNAGSFPANRYTTGMTSATSVAINFAEKEMVILGTEYAGEMKKGVFTVLFYEMPVKHNVLTLHSSANEGKDGDVTVFFGLSGTGKTTLSADPKRALIGDDEHCWSENGIFNIEGGVWVQVSEHLLSTNLRCSVMQSALVSLQRRNLIFSMPSDLGPFLRMLSSALRLAWSIMMTPHSRKILDGVFRAHCMLRICTNPVLAHIRSSISRISNGPACPIAIPPTSFC